MQKSTKVLIVGGVAGGASAAARLRRLDENAEIILFERGEFISFANCGLPYYVGGYISEKSALTIQTPESFNARLNVDVRVYNEVIAIDKEAKKVKVKNNKTCVEYEESYDKLILSMGAEPIKPSIDGIDSNKVFTLRNIPDADKIKNYIDNNKPKKAVVVGGGYIGVEMAENLQNAGIAVTLIEMQDQVIAPLDYDMACDVHRYIESKGVRLLLGETVRSIRETGNGLQVNINASEVQTDMLILAIGVSPESRISKDTGLTVNERGCIVVNDNMLTSDSNIYAVGDVVEVKNFITEQKAYIPLAGPANKQGRIAADNICGIDSKYTGTQGSSILKVFDMTVASTGVNEKTVYQLGRNYEKSLTYSGSHANDYPGAFNMVIKTILIKIQEKF